MTPSDKLREIAESSFVNISDEMKYIQKLLPDHYRCEQRGNGVRCISDIGINEVTEEGYWRVFIIALKVRYRDRFMEVFHQTCSDHKEFTVYIKEQSMADKLSAFAEKWSTEIAGNYDDELDVVTMLTNEDELLSDLTALISEGYYPKEFTRWFRSEKFYDIFQESTDGEGNMQWEYLHSGQVLNTTDELFNYWKENEQC